MMTIQTMMMGQETEDHPSSSRIRRPYGVTLIAFAPERFLL